MWRRSVFPVIAAVAVLGVVVGLVLAIGRDPRSSRAASAPTNSPVTSSAPCASTIVDGDATVAATAAQRRAAQRLIDDTRAAVQPFTDFAAASRAGFRRLDPVHWYQPDWYADETTLDPAKPEFLMYDGDRRLLGAMFVDHDGPGPRVGGALTTWHTHCASQMPCLLPGNVLLEPEDERCRGEMQVRDWMLHVWLVPNRLGPFGHEMVVPTARS